MKIAPQGEYLRGDFYLGGGMALAPLHIWEDHSSIDVNR